MASQIEIYNMALGNIGNSQTVAGLQERSKEQLTCSQYWENARDTALAEFPWPFATKRATLAKLEGVSNGWAYRYAYPTDCLRAMYLASPGMLQPDEKYQPQYDIEYTDAMQVIITNQAGAELVYVTRVTDPGRYPALFVDALAWKLASKIAMPLTNTRTIAESAAQLYTQAVQIAWSSALNESKYDHDHPSEYVTVRGADSLEGSDFLARRGY